jgi:uncharacterized protein (TIGR03085 family)
MTAPGPHPADGQHRRSAKGELQVRRFALAERLALADLMARTGPDAPTLCGEWTVRDLAAHLVLRERRPDAAGGILLKRLAGHTARVQQKIAAREFSQLLAQVRKPAWPPFVDEAFNLSEMFVHQEDVRRTAPGWEPRALPSPLQDALWRQVRRRVPFVLRRFRAVVHVEAPGFGTATGGKGGPRVYVRGEPGELLIFLFGRQTHSLATVDGDPTLADRLRRARLGV